MDILVIDKFSDWSMQRYCKRTVRTQSSYGANGKVSDQILLAALRGLLLILSRPE